MNNGSAAFYNSRRTSCKHANRGSTPAYNCRRVARGRPCAERRAAHPSGAAPRSTLALLIRRIGTSEIIVEGDASVSAAAITACVAMRLHARDNCIEAR